MRNIFTNLILFVAVSLHAQQGWHLINPFPTNNTLNSVSFINDNTGWMAGNNSVLLKTTDGGTTWKTQNAIAGYHIYAVQFVDAQTGWLVNGNGAIAKSNDGGDSWNVQLPYTNYYTTGFQFTDNQHGFVLKENDSLIYTTNGGTQWNKIAINSSEDLYGMTFVNNSEGWVCGENGEILHTSNGGTSWNKQISGNTSDYEAIDFISTGEGWAAGYNVIDKSILLHTSNGGVKWDTVIQNSLLRFYGLRFINATTGFAISDKLYKTTDGGKTWAPVYTTSEGINDLIVLPSGIGYLCGSNGLISKTTNTGSAWSQLSRSATHGATIVPIDFPDERSGWILSDKLLHTTDSGYSWVDQTPFPGSFQGSAFDFVDTLRGWLVGKWPSGGYGQILRTIDGGKTFNFQLNTGVFPFRNVSFCDSLHGIAGSVNRMIYYTANGGTTWDSTTIPAIVPYSQITSIQMVDPLNGWAIASYTYKTYLEHTINGGQTWSLVMKDTIQFTAAYSSLSFVDAMHGYISIFDFYGNPNKSYLLQTSNGGTSWTKINFPPGSAPNQINQVHFIDMMHGWVASGGTQSFIMYTNDGGATWATQERGTTVSWYGLSIVNAKTGYAAGWNGDMVKTSDASFVGINKSKEKISSNISLFPNPANGQLTIDYPMSDNSPYVIYNSIGQIVLEGSLKQAQSILDVSSLLPGIYFFRVNESVVKFVKE